MSWLTTHVLDTARGLPASGVAVRCEIEQGGEFLELSRGETDADGRLKTLLEPGTPVPGVYRLSFATAEYFCRQQVDAFFPRVEITFTVSADVKHYHVPLLISPFGYSTYRGS